MSGYRTLQQAGVQISLPEKPEGFTCMDVGAGMGTAADGNSSITGIHLIRSTAAEEWKRLNRFQG